jgi:hypothetical protein
VAAEPKLAEAVMADAAVHTHPALVETEQVTVETMKKIVRAN